MQGTGARFVYILRSDSDPARHYVGRTGQVDERLHWHNEGPNGSTVKHRPWRVIATEAAVVAQAAQLAGARATLTVLAGPDLPALPGELIAREVTIIGVAGPHPDLIVEAAALCVKGEIDLVAGVGEHRTQARVTT